MRSTAGRELLGVTRPLWSGDVWKAIVQLRSTRHDLRIAVLRCDRGVGVVRKGFPESRLSYSAAQIEALNYADLAADRDRLLNEAARVSRRISRVRAPSLPEVLNKWLDCPESPRIPTRPPEQTVLDHGHANLGRQAGFFSDGKLFIIGRVKDLLIAYARSHFPDDIEAIIQEITRGRCVAMTVPDEGTEKLVAIIELKKRGGTHQDAMDELAVLKREVTSADSMSRGLSVADLVLVPAGSFPITTSGKVRRSAWVSSTGKINCDFGPR